MEEMTTLTVTLIRNSGSLTLKRVLRPRCKNSTVVRAGLVAHAFQDYVYPYDHTQPTIMDKSLGTVVQFERFLTHAKLHPRTTNTVRPYPLPPPHGQCWNRQGTIPLIFQHCIGWGGGRGHGFVKWQRFFLRHYLSNAYNWSYALTVPRTFVHDCAYEINPGIQSTHCNTK